MSRSRIRILFVTQYYSPEIGAASTRVSELSGLLGAMGVEVMVLTGMPSYPRAALYTGFNPESDSTGPAGVKVVRVSHSGGVAGGVSVRLRSYLGFAWAAARKVHGLMRDSGSAREPRLAGPDAIVATTGPPPVAGLGAYISKVTGAPLILEYRDLAYLQMTATHRGGIIGQQLMRIYEESLARRAAHVVVVTEAFRRILVRRGVKADKVTVIPNGVLAEIPADRETLMGGDTDLLEIVGSWRPTFAYLGTLGLSQGVAELVPVFGQSRRARLLIVGDGADSEAVRETAAQYRETVRVHGAVPENVLTPLYRSIDFHIVKLRCTPEFSATLPSKLFRIAGQGGIPIFIGPEGEAAELVRQIDPRLVCHSVDTLGDRLDDLVQLTPGELEQLKMRAKGLVSKEYDRRVQAERYLAVISDVVARFQSSRKAVRRRGHD